MLSHLPCFEMQFVYLHPVAHAVSHVTDTMTTTLREQMGGDTQSRLKPHLITSPDQPGLPDFFRTL